MSKVSRFHSTVSSARSWRSVGLLALIGSLSASSVGCVAPTQLDSSRREPPREDSAPAGTRPGQRLDQPGTAPRLVETLPDLEQPPATSTEPAVLLTPPEAKPTTRVLSPPAAEQSARSMPDKARARTAAGGIARKSEGLGLSHFESEGAVADRIMPSPFPTAVPNPPFHTEAYRAQTENGFVSTFVSPLSTFSIDVDTASYSNVRRFLNQGQRPPAGAVRIEELINYFHYAYPEPSAGRPFAVYTELGPAPWAPEHQLLHVGLQAKKVEPGEVGPKNLVFLVDVSGSMEAPNKLPLLKSSFASLVDTLAHDDRVAIVVYAGASGVVLSPTLASDKATIRSALDRLSAGGSTNGAAGIELAYDLARQSFVANGVNRVVLATDGDFNVGTTSENELVRLIENKRQLGIYLTVLGFGMGNYKDSTLEYLADKGNGNYAYIDNEREARKVLVEQGGSTLITVAKDVKIQIEFNPQWVGAYRLVGYENRALANEDFNDDKKDAGEVGSGHTVTALYELLTVEQAKQQLSIDGLKYRTLAETSSSSAELATIKLRYKEPASNASALSRYVVMQRAPTLEQTSDEFRFSAAVAGFGMLLSGSAHAGKITYSDVTRIASGASHDDPGGYRAEFLGLVTQAGRL